MSRLRELRLHGFKSFADPTRFVFEPGVNAVLGPNGSGKSNMADAVRWVLGEQSNRSLRTRRADDVIFAGSEQRKPQGMAEAVLTLDNADGWLPIEFAEVSIGRRAYRSGETEYLINGARARLRDVVELLGEGRLGANELVVVGQGTVDAALSLRPEERRQLFEEAAGVKALQVKRNEASSRLARALDNLTRVSDLVTELKPQVRRLALQAEHQQQHDSLGSRASALVAASHRRREQAARALLGDARRTAAAAEAALEAYRASQEKGRTAIADAEARYWEADEAARAAARVREETREALIRAEGRVEAVEARLAALRAQVGREEGELAEAERAVVSEEDAPSDAMAAALEEAHAAEGAWRAALGDLAAADDSLLAAEEAVAAVRSRDSDRIAAAARSEEQVARRRSRHDQAVAERDVAVAELDAAGRRLEVATQGLEASTAAAVATSDALDAAERSRDDSQAETDTARQLAVELTERLRATRAEQDAISGPGDSATRLGRRLADAGWPALLDSMEAPETAWAAIEAVVGGELEGAVLWSDGDPSDQLGGARGSARLLASDEDGDAAGRRAALEAVSAERTLDEWLGMSDAPTVFRRAVLAPDLQTLLDGWRRLPVGWMAVTADGEVADARGVVVLRGRADPPGGAAARAHSRRRELADLGAQLERESAEAQGAAHDATERLRVARAAHLGAGESADAAERRARAGRGEHDVVTAAVRRAEERVALLDAELASLDADAEPAAAIPAPAAAELASLERAAAEARSARDALAVRRDEARQRWTTARAAADAAETLTVGQRRDRAAREARVAQLRASIPGVRAEEVTLTDERDGLAAALSAAQATDAASSSRLEAAEQARAARREELLELERGQGAVGSQLAELERAAQAAIIEASRRDEALVSLARERELALEGLPAIADAAPDEEIEALGDEAVDAELRRVRRLLSQIGSVNPFALEEHREVAARLEEMTSQERDLRGAIASTEELITRLDGEIAGRFDSAFKAIGERFNEYCGLLFAGGSGSLAMGDEEDGDAPGGIEIVVRPPGKRLQRLGMLSGGERALTGVALLFAMLSVNPVPFCILDEVDAALDEANIGRFAQALRRLSESIDFVVITHNRATIEVADTIYGVTMTDAAVSRVLSMRLADLPAEVVA
ncbi:MAG: chromosome segregation protein SMC [Chloroflexota bacterium]